MHVPDSAAEYAGAPAVKSNFHGLAIQRNIVVPLKSILGHSSTFELHICSAIGLSTAVAHTWLLQLSVSHCHMCTWAGRTSAEQGRAANATRYLVSSYRTPHFFNVPLTENSSCRVSSFVFVVVDQRRECK